MLVRGFVRAKSELLEQDIEGSIFRAEVICSTWSGPNAPFSIRSSCVALRSAGPSRGAVGQRARVAALSRRARVARAKHRLLVGSSMLTTFVLVVFFETPRISGIILISEFVSGAQRAEYTSDDSAAFRTGRARGR